MILLGGADFYEEQRELLPTLWLPTAFLRTAISYIALLLRQEVADIRKVLFELGQGHPSNAVRHGPSTIVIDQMLIRFVGQTVVVCERHHIRFFPLSGPCCRQGSLVVDFDVTHPFENNIYLLPAVYYAHLSSKLGLLTITC